MKPVCFLLLLLISSVAVATDSQVAGADVAPPSQSNLLQTFGHAVDASVVLGTITSTRTFTFVADPRTQRPCPEGLSNAARSPSNTETEAPSGNVTTIPAPGGSFITGDPLINSMRVGYAIFLCNPNLPPFEKDRDRYRSAFGDYRPHDGAWARRHGRGDDGASDRPAGVVSGEATRAAAFVDGSSSSTYAAGDVSGTVVRSSSGVSSFSGVPATISAVLSLANPQSSCDSVPVPISALDYVGMRLDLNSSGQPRNVYCVQASNDTQAHSACGGDTGGYSPINPGNPQYGITDEGDSNNTRRTNSAGYYFCVSKSPEENIKQEICNAANMPGFKFRWVPIGGAASRDGNCECREDKAPDVDSSYSMNCSARDLNRTAVAAANAQAASASQPVNPVAPTPDNIQTFQACVDHYKQNAQDCKNNADQANRICDPSNVRVEGSNTAAGQAAGAAGSLASVYTQLNSGSGSQASCFNAGLLANAARMTAQQSNEQCTTGISTCHSQCTEDQYDNFRNECAQKLGMTPDQLSAATTAQAQTYRTESANIQQLFQQGHDVCENQAAPKSNTLNNMLSGVGNALQGSLRCACQLSSSASSSTAATTTAATQSGCNAANIPNVQDCAANPALSGCQVYTELSVCTPGSTYNAALCRCQTNPSADGCADVPTTGTLASMAGSAIKAGATASVDGFTSPNLGSATAPQNLDLSGGESSGASLDATAKAGAAGSRQPYVGGGGDGGAGGGGAVAANAEGGAGAAADKDGIIGGLMNALKTGARALGFGKDKGNGAYGSSDSGALGRGSFKPRGIAGGRSGIGSRNMEIWTMMNKCVQAETCPSNSQQYILAP